MDASDRVALVTGGSRGIGRAIVEALAASGMRVALSYRERKEEADEVLAHLAGAGRTAMAARADVGSAPECVQPAVPLRARLAHG